MWGLAPSVPGLRRSLKSWLGASCLLVASMTGASADLVYTPRVTPNGPAFLLVSGDFSASDDLKAFSDAVAKNGSSVVLFDSPGGDVRKAMELGRLIRRLDLRVVQFRNLECASACALAFVGGVSRYADPGSIGVHKTSFMGGSPSNVDDAVAAVQQVTAEVIGYLVEMDVDPALLQVALTYDSNDIRYLSGSEMAKFRVTNVQDDSLANEASAAPTTEPVPEPRPDPTLVVPAPAAPPQPVFPAPQALFYEERTATADGSAESGTVIWSLVQQSPGNNAPPEPIIRGDAVIPGKGVQLSLTIKRNVDATVPASHTIEMIFITPANFDGGGIDNILRVAFKDREEAAGTPLLGIPVKIAEDYFLVALNDGASDSATNLAVLQRDQWIDIPLVLKSGRRALFTMEKGPSGDRAFNGAITAWRQAAAAK